MHDGAYLARLSSLILEHGKDAFITIYRDEYKDTQNERLLIKNINDNLHLRQALMLIQWYYFLDMIKETLPDSSTLIDEWLASPLSLLQHTHGKETIKSAFTRAIKLYGQEIITYKEQKDKEGREQLSILIFKRDSVRKMLDHIDRTN